MSEAFRELIISQKDLLNEAVQKAKNLLRIEEDTGNVIVRVPKLSGKALRYAQMLGEDPEVKQSSHTVVVPWIAGQAGDAIQFLVLVRTAGLQGVTDFEVLDNSFFIH